jgi:hypothetical protein
VREEFVLAWTRDRSPGALVLVAFWCVLLALVDDKYWLRGAVAVPDMLSAVSWSLNPEFLEVFKCPAEDI